MSFLESLTYLISRLVDLFKKNKKNDNEVDTKPDTNADSAPTPVSPSLPENTTPAQPTPTTVTTDPTGDPPVTDVTSQVQSFLWKPISDTNPVCSVITVSADKIRSEDLKVEILDKNDVIIPGLLSVKNKYSNGRGNPLPGFKFARINFKPGLTDKQFKKYAPIKVRFYIESSTIKKTYIKVMNKDFILIKDPTQRLDLR